VFGTTWYYRLDLPGVKEFVAAYQKQFPGMAIKVPGNVYHNSYMATRELLRCVEEAGTTNNIAVIKKLEGRKMSARDRLQHYDAWIDPVTHQCQQTIYMASYNDQPAEKDDIFKILTLGRSEGRGRRRTPPRPASWSRYDATPSFSRDQRSRFLRCRSILLHARPGCMTPRASLPRRPDRGGTAALAAGLRRPLGHAPCVGPGEGRRSPC
jgi:hypothetical protein